MRFTMDWVGRQDKRLAKLKQRKNQIATELQRSPQQFSAPIYQIPMQLQLRLPTQTMHVQTSTSIISKNKNSLPKFKAENKKWRPNKLQPFDVQYQGTFQESISPVLLLAQIFALMPIRGITSKSAKDLKFSWTHVRSIYSLFVLMGFGTYCGFTIADVIYGKYSFDAAETVIFNMSTFLISAALFSLARKWRTLILEWEDTEMKLLTMLRGTERSRMAYRIKVIMFIATLCSLIEHALSMASMFYYIEKCPVLPGRPLDSFLLMTSNQFFHFINYKRVYGLLGKLINIYATFTWNFNDIFIMSVSVGLSSRFQELNEHMLKAATKPSTEEFWVKCRTNYQNLCRLCESLDDTISWTVLLCFSNNLYFICSKILKSLQDKPSFSHTAYFWFSLGYLLGRTLILSLCTSSINEEAKRPLIIFRSVSREYWCTELKRFSNEVANDGVALSGLKFFRLTRSVVLSVAGTIVTYELVLLQYNKEGKIDSC